MNSILYFLIASSLCAADEYSITVNSVGIGNNWRAGDMTPIHLSISSNATEAITAWVQWEVPDVDGDLVLWGRPMTLSSQGTTSTWLYAPTRGWDRSDTPWSIRLRSWENSEPTSLLASTRFSPQSVGAMRIRSTEGIIAIFGTRRLGLEGYLPLSPSSETKQEATKIVSGLTSKDLPDAWPSFQSLEALVWADATPEFSFRQSEAIGDWIQRGGHLVITLPTIGDPWSLGSQNSPLASILPDLHPTIEHIPVRMLQNIVGRQKNRPAIEIQIRVFGRLQDSWPRELTPLLWLDDGRVIAVQSTIGFGAVTIIGIDLTSGRLASLGLPETDVLWNRVLGKRSDTPSQMTLTQLGEEESKSKSIPTTTRLRAGTMIAQKIAMSTTASGRLSTVFLLIVTYWLIGGPLGYFVLKRKKKQRWSWVWFASTACVFTIGTWVMAASTAGVRTPLKHVTVVDHVYGEVGQRAIGWFSVFLPSYGRSTVTLQGDDNNILFPWTPPDGSMTPSFVDRREIVVNIDHVPHSFEQPSRATTANFSFQWLGGIEGPYYGSLIRVDSTDMPSARFNRDNSPLGLAGSILNNTTADLQEVTVLWITNKQLQPAQFDRNTDGKSVPWVNIAHSGQPLNEAYTWKVGTWRTGTSLNLLSYLASDEFSFSQSVLKEYGRKSTSKWESKMEMLSLYSHLTPPTYQKHPNEKQSPSSHHSIREGGRELDFSQWFGRSCIIVMGFLPNAPIPVPIQVDGEPMQESQGVTFVRWIFPLEQLP